MNTQPAQSSGEGYMPKACLLDNSRWYLDSSASGQVGKLVQNIVGQVLPQQLQVCKPLAVPAACLHSLCCMQGKQQCQLRGKMMETRTAPARLNCSCCMQGMWQGSAVGHCLPAPPLLHAGQTVGSAVRHDDGDRAQPCQTAPRLLHAGFGQL